MSDWVRGARSAFDLGAATNAEMSGTRAGELFLRLATVDTARLTHFQEEEAAKRRRAAAAAAAKKGLPNGVDDDPLGMGKQMERERRAQERRQQGEAAAAVSAKGSAKKRAEKNAAMSMGQIFETCSVTFDTFMQVRTDCTGARSRGASWQTPRCGPCIPWQKGCFGCCVRVWNRHRNALGFGFFLRFSDRFFCVSFSAPPPHHTALH